MGHFSYKAVEQSGSHVSGTIEAPDRRTAVELLAGKGHFVTELLEGASQAGGAIGAAAFKGIAGRIASKDIMAMTNQLSTALRAGLPLLNTLKIIEQQQHKPGIKKLMADLVDSVSGGQSLSESMGKHPNVFSPLYLSMIRVGEMGGILEKTTLQLTSILQRDDKIKTNMKNAAAYPIFVLVLGFVSVGVIIAFILPKIISTIIGGMAVLPWPTRLLLGMSSFLTWCFTTIYGWVGIIAAIAGIVYLWRWIKTDGRLQWDGFKLKVPVLGSVLRTIAVGRFTRTLGSLTKGGVPILESLGIVRDTLGNELLAREIDAAAEKVKTGSAVGPALQESGYFPPLLVQIVSIGEQTGQLDELLLSAADTFDEIADAAIARFMAVFPALMILLLALVIGFMIVAILLPIAMMSLGAGVF